MSDPRTKFDDAVGAAHSFIHAMKRMAEATCNGQGEDYCAFSLLADNAIKELSDADAAFTKLEDGEACR